MWIVLKIKSDFFIYTLQKVSTAAGKTEFFQKPRRKLPRQIFKIINYCHTIALSSEDWLTLCTKVNGKMQCKHVKTTSMPFHQTYQLSTLFNK